MREERYFDFVKRFFGDIRIVTPHTNFLDEIEGLSENSIEFKLLCFKELHDSLFRPIANIKEEDIEDIIDNNICPQMEYKDEL
jgi:hypothetical protein